MSACALIYSSVQALESLRIVTGWQEVYEYTLYTPLRFIYYFCLVVNLVSEIFVFAN